MDVRAAVLPNDGTFACSICHKKYTTKSSAERHIKTAHNGERFPCTQCGKTFAYRNLVARHVESVHKKKKYPCKTCKTVYTDKSSLAKHEKAHHAGQQHVCKHCAKKYTFKNALDAHVLAIHKGVRFKCPHCEIEMTKKINLQKHISRFHVGQALVEQRTFPCQLCGKVFNLKGNHTLHMKVHDLVEAGRPYVAPKQPKVIGVGAVPLILHGIEIRAASTTSGDKRKWNVDLEQVSRPHKQQKQADTS
mmetsp:Transcript_1767/g.2902  ORF Transcript_1767/g.2902 Transcript_1767/m.2902 type:complete len:248 (-) Transcript_1767:419-1162(-)